MKRSQAGVFPEELLIHNNLQSGKTVKSIRFFAAKIGKKQISIRPFSGESIIVILSGTVNGAAGTEKFSDIGGRTSVFEGFASAIFIPAGYPIILSSNNGAEIALAVSTLKPKTKNLKPFVIQPSQNKSRIVGKGRYKRRVTDILQSNHNADYLLAGETVSLPGMWSSYPPHKHDTSLQGRETIMEEIYFYRTEKPARFALQCIYSQSKSKCMMVYNNDVVSIPSGYHPVSAPPDSKLYYLWVLSGKHRRLLYSQDPGYA